MDVLHDVLNQLLDGRTVDVDATILRFYPHAFAPSVTPALEAMRLAIALLVADYTHAPYDRIREAQAMVNQLGSVLAPLVQSATDGGP